MATVILLTYVVLAYIAEVITDPFLGMSETVWTMR